jgi:hypothetical protein
MPQVPFCDLAIDFVGPLKAAAHYDMILTCTDCISGFVRIIPVLQKDTAEKTAARFFSGWLATFGAPVTIISDRDKTWTSKFWKCLMEKLNIKFHMTSAFHPQADGRSNKTIGQALRSFTAKKQSRWLESLPAVEYAINSAVNVATGYSPFELAFGRQPRLFPLSNGPTDKPRTLSSWLKQREGSWADARDNLWVSRVKQAFQHNKRCRQQPPITAGSWTLLDSADWRGCHQGGTNKLKERYEGPYCVVRVFNNGQSIKLELPQGDCPHPTFHISKIKLFVELDELAGKGLTKVSSSRLCTAG